MNIIAGQLILSADRMTAQNGVDEYWNSTSAIINGKWVLPLRGEVFRDDYSHTFNPAGDANQALELVKTVVNSPLGAEGYAKVYCRLINTNYYDHELALVDVFKTLTPILMAKAAIIHYINQVYGWGDLPDVVFDIS